VKFIVRTSAFLLSTAVLIAVLLGFTYKLTQEPIAHKMTQTREDAMKEVLPHADVFMKIQVETPGNITGAYRGTESGRETGYVAEMAIEGYAGRVDLLVGISSVDAVVTGMRILKHSETPGLGALAVKESFYKQFDNRRLEPLTVVKVSPGDLDIDAITGATVTTRAITRAVNEAIEWYNGGGVQ